ncbi:hypothetical protein CRENBAI_009671 [Crenichthys baileyi]|uniref:Uncharacterized protein n=1 Tax=Crenichthys baileyi TaxID=28760 RepID=A0AAV9R4V6_9TELE
MPSLSCLPVHVCFCHHLLKLLISEQRPCFRAPTSEFCLAPGQTTPLIFYGALLADERTQRVCLLKWNCIKERREKKGGASPAVTLVRPEAWLLGLNR